MAEQSDGVVYLSIPYDYLCTYQRLINYMADFGEDALKNCDTTCKGSNKNVIKCWNMFQAALAAKASGRTKLANTLVSYIDGQLDIIYKSAGSDSVIPGSLYPVNDEGYVRGDVTCVNGIEFFIPTEDGEDGKTCDGQPVKAWNLYVMYYGNQSQNRDFDLITDENKDLIVTSDYSL